PAGISVRIARAAPRRPGKCPSGFASVTERLPRAGASCRLPTSRSSRNRVALKNYYGLLEIAATASVDEIKKAFRQQIARYHPDKVQHLGKEFQDMAADRAAELTEAYRVLSDEGRRAEYDRAVADAGGLPASASGAVPPPPSGSPPRRSEDEAAPPPPPPPS